MRFQCDKDKLADGLNTALKAVSSRSTLPILQSFLLKSAGQAIKCIGNDLEMGIEATVPANIAEEGMIAVNARMFFEIVKKRPDGEITIASEGTTIKIASGRSEFNINAEDSKEFIMLPEVEKNRALTLPQAVLKKKISQTIFSISLDDNRKVLQGELFDIVGGSRSKTNIRKVPLSFPAKLCPRSKKYYRPKKKTWCRFILPISIFCLKWIKRSWCPELLTALFPSTCKCFPRILKR